MATPLTAKVLVVTSKEGVAPSASTSGRDGTATSLAEAQQLVRRWIAEGESGAIEVRLGGGTHVLDETLVLTQADSGTAQRPIIWTASPGETPVLTGAQPITGWRRCDGPTAPQGLSTEARAQVWFADLPEAVAGRWTFSVLFDSQGLLLRARSGGKQTSDAGKNESHDELKFAQGDLRNWPSLSDVEIFLCPKWPWTVNYLPVTQVDETRGVARVAISATYPLTSAAHGLPGSASGAYYVENVPEAMTQPGHWIIDATRGRVYLWPRDGGEPRGISAPRLTELIRFEGDFENQDWTRHIVLRGLIFTHGDRMRWRPQRKSLQHDWEQFDEANALVRLRGAENITIEDCKFVDSGSSGVRADLHAVNNRLVHNEMARLGAVGVSLVGYGPGTRDENRGNEIAFNHIHDIGLLWWHSAGIFVWQSGDNHIHDNLIHEVPYCGIVISGVRQHVFEENEKTHEGRRNIRFDEIGGSPIDWPYRAGFLHARWNLIENNEIHHAMERLGDGNGVYLSGAGVGNVVRRNYVHDLEGSGAHSGIRIDNEQWHSRILENVIWRINGGGITLKEVNDVENNIVVDCRRMGSILIRSSGTAGAAVQRNILVQPAEIRGGGKMSPFYQDGGNGGSVSEPIIDDNLLFCTDRPEAARQCVELMREMGKDQRSVVADPLFVDGAKGDFRLREKSPALKIGFLPIEKWGLTAAAGPRVTGK